jgi:hypothetical protein
VDSICSSFWLNSHLGWWVYEFLNYGYWVGMDLVGSSTSECYKDEMSVKVWFFME